jgi:N-acetylglucosamine-6-phosphate deacetylase
MTQVAITASTLLTPVDRIDRPLLLLEDSHIVDVASQHERSMPNVCRHVDFAGATLCPGFIDIHIHGAAGHDVMEAQDGSLYAIQHLLAQHGVTGYLPTTITAPLEEILSALDRLANAIEAASQVPHTRSAHAQSNQAQPLGIHIEGPFLSHERRGVHPPEHLQKPTLALLNRMWEASRGHIKLITIAPEIEGAMEVIGEAVRRGICISIGHSDAHLDAARAGFLAGARHATHTFNAMRPLGHRDPGILGFVLTEHELSADIIADGIHVAPEIIDLFFRAKGRDRAVLITDALSATGMPDGHYHLGSFEFEVHDGRCTAHGTLAGSVLTLDKAVRNLMKFARVDLQQALPSATLNPARTIGVGANRGRLAAGASADIVVLDANQQVIKTIVRGQGI